MNIFIREARETDAQSISRLIKDSMGYDNPAELIYDNIRRISGNGCDKIFVAEYNGEIIGFVHAENYDCLYSPPFKDLMSLAVNTAYQNKHVGTKLLEEVEKWAKESGRCGVRVLSSAHRLSAHAFYKARGYTSEKSQLNFHKIF